MNSIEICTELRKMEKYKETSIIAVTSFAMTEDKEHIMFAGFNNYLSKPIKIQEFKNLVLSYLHEADTEK